MKTYQTNVLIVGGGGAATAAALGAHEAGAAVTLAVKGRFGVAGVRGAGATSNPRADFWTMRTVGRPDGLFNPPDKVFLDMQQIGLGMADARLCRIYVDEVAEAIARLGRMGLNFQSKMLAVMPAVKESGGTNSIVAVQKKVMERTGAKVIEEANLTDLIVEDGRCCGAMGIHDSGEPFIVRAGAVVLATGGVGQLFKYSFNPPGNTGDGYAMALRAGAELVNMEFMQQGIATTWPCQAMVMLYEMPEPYRLYNREGSSFMHRYLPAGLSLEEVSRCKAQHWPVSCRDDAIHLDRAIHGEALQNRATEHDGVFLDLSRARRAFLPEMFVDYMSRCGINLDHDLLQVQNHHHTSNGGIRVNEHGHSRVRGLFAAGEAMAFQGADRLGGTMLSGSQVFGRRAGLAAAELAREQPRARAEREVVDHLLHQPLAKLQGSKGHLRPNALLEPLQRKMRSRLLVEKDAEQLDDARAFIREDRQRLEKDVRIVEPFDLVEAFEHRSLLDVGEAIVGAANLRTESRGSHYRSDFPERADAQWLTNIFITRRDGALHLDKRWVNERWSDRPQDLRIQPWG